MTLLKTEEQLIMQYSDELQHETAALHSSIRMQEGHIDALRTASAVLCQEIVEFDSEVRRLREELVQEMLSCSKLLERLAGST